MVNLQELIKEGSKELTLFVHKCELDKNNYTNEILWAGGMEEYNNTWVTFKASTVTNDWLFGGNLGSGEWSFTSEWLFESDCREEDNTLVAEHVDITESDWSEGYKQFLEEVSTLEDDSPTVIIAPEQMLGSIKPVTKEKSTGGSSSYYKVVLPQWLLDKQTEQGFIMIEDLAEVLYNNNFNYTNNLKAQNRMFELEQGGGKEGNEFEYDATKCKYYIDKQVEVYNR